MLTFSLTCAVLSAPISIYVAPKFPLKWLVLFGYGLTALGFGERSPSGFFSRPGILRCLLRPVRLGTMMTLNQHSPIALQECLPLIVGLGFSFLLKLPNDLLTAALQDKHLASANGNFFLVRTMGCTTGLSIAAAIFSTRLQSLLKHVPYDLDPKTVQWKELIHIEPVGLKEKVLGAVSRALAVCIPFSHLDSLLRVNRERT